MDYKSLKIKDWAVEDRPREKLLAKGISSLSNAELIATLIGSGNRDESAVELSKRILHGVNNNLNELGKRSVTELQVYKGIGEAKAITVAAALELGRRRKLAELVHKVQISSSKDVYELMQPKLSDLQDEEFWVIYLNRSNKIIDEQKMSEGGNTGTVVDIKKILKHAILNRISSIILCHNHPSGNIKPSRADENITQKLKEAAQFVDVQVLDHIIVSEVGYFSFADENIL